MSMPRLCTSLRVFWLTSARPFWGGGNVTALQQQRPTVLVVGWRAWAIPKRIKSPKRVSASINGSAPIDWENIPASTLPHHATYLPLPPSPLARQRASFRRVETYPRAGIFLTKKIILAFGGIGQPMSYPPLPKSPHEYNKNRLCFGKKKSFCPRVSAFAFRAAAPACLSMRRATRLRRSYGGQGGRRSGTVDGCALFQR
jgi:hypothetical protein